MPEQVQPRRTRPEQEAAERKFSNELKAIAKDLGFTAYAGDYHDALVTRFSWKVAVGEVRASGYVLWDKEPEISLTWFSPWNLVYTVLESIPPFCFVTPFIKPGKVDLVDHAEHLSLDEIRERIGRWLDKYPPK